MYNRKNPKHHRLERIERWMQQFIEKHRVIPSIHTISKEFDISKSTAYALWNELRETKRILTEGLPYENTNLPLQSVSGKKAKNTKEKQGANVPDSGKEVGRSSDD